MSKSRGGAIESEDGQVRMDVTETSVRGIIKAVNVLSQGLLISAITLY